MTSKSTPAWVYEPKENKDINLSWSISNLARPVSAKKPDIPLPKPKPPLNRQRNSKDSRQPSVEGPEIPKLKPEGKVEPGKVESIVHTPLDLTSFVGNPGLNTGEEIVTKSRRNRSLSPLVTQIEGTQNQFPSGMISYN